jgi:MFS family permease
LVYLGYGLIGGIGLGIGYISPVSTLMKWFPDRPGLATGMAIMGFGGGAMVAAPLSSRLLSLYGGGAAIAPGSAVTKLFITLGVAYFIVMMLGVFTVRVPAPGWQPPHFDPSKANAKSMVTTANVSARNAIKTPQFWLLWTVLLCNVTAGIGILEQAAEMIQDFFRTAGSSTVTVTAAAGFVGLLSVANMSGRIGWSTTSDYLGRKPSYMLYLGGGMLLYSGLAILGASSTALFVVLCFFIITFYGGGFSTVPAYLRDLFGTYQVGAIHGRLLTAWSTAGVLGPLIVNGILDSQGKPGNLVASDYRPALFTMVGVLIVGFVANLLIRPVADRWHEKSPVMDAVAAAHRPAPTEDVAVEPEDIPIVEEELVIAERPHPQNSYRN